MEISYDPAKSEQNALHRSLPFSSVVDFHFETAAYHVDDRHNYGETRLIAVGYLARRLHVLCFTETHNGIRVISLRRANDKEAKHYGKPKTFDK